MKTRLGTARRPRTHRVTEARHKGEDRVDWIFVGATAVYNVVRVRNLLEAAACRVT